MVMCKCNQARLIERTTSIPNGEYLVSVPNYDPVKISVIHEHNLPGRELDGQHDASNWFTGIFRHYGHVLLMDASLAFQECITQVHYCPDCRELEFELAWPGLPT
ncbi:MAG: hypothetical protein WCO23_01615 [bacterium]